MAATTSRYGAASASTAAMMSLPSPSPNTLATATTSLCAGLGRRAAIIGRVVVGAFGVRRLGGQLHLGPRACRDRLIRGPARIHQHGRRGIEDREHIARGQVLGVADVGRL